MIQLIEFSKWIWFDDPKCMVFKQVSNSVEQQDEQIDQKKHYFHLITFLKDKGWCTTHIWKAKRWGHLPSGEHAELYTLGILSPINSVKEG